MTTTDEWNDSTKPPSEPATDLGGGVWVTWAGVFNEPPHPLIWHWCTGVVRIKTGVTLVPDFYPRWLPAGVKAHTLVTSDPLHLEPSLLWADCCGMHGFIRDGKWASC